MSRVGLVLGGGGITGGAYEHAALLAIQMATGWNPVNADVIVGTSSGAFMAAQARAGKLEIEHFVGASENDEELAERMREQIYADGSGANWRRWVRHGVLASLAKPGLTLFLGSPARYGTDGLLDWITDQIGPLAEAWPEKPTIITAYDIEAKQRVAFGTLEAPDVALKDAVAASAAVPIIFEPHEIDGRAYVDGGVTSGTHADLVLGARDALDLVIIVAPMAAEKRRRGGRFYEGVLDRVGRKALKVELELIAEAWPQCDVLVLRPGGGPLAEMRPNPMDASAAIPTFVRSLSAMRRELSKPSTWQVLNRHCRAEAEPMGPSEPAGLKP